MSDLRKYWQKLEYVLTNKKGKHIHKFKCTICNKIYTNHNNANTHVCNCLKAHKMQSDQSTLSSFGIGTSTPSQQPQYQSELIEESNTTEEPICMSQRDIALIELIADANIPYTQINTQPWLDFIHTFCPDYKVPSGEMLRKMIIQHASHCLDTGLNEMKNEVCGIAVDGATLMSKHCYAFILVNPSGLRLAGIKEVHKQDAVTLASTVGEVLKDCKQSQIYISGIVSDNAPSLVKALIDNDANNENTLLAIVGNEVIRVACSAHTGQLVIGDLIKQSSMEDFFIAVTNTIQYLKVHRDTFITNCPHKIPSYISTRWNTLHACADFLMRHRDLINDFIQATALAESEDFERKQQMFTQGRIKNQPVPPTPPPIEMIPSEWQHYVDALKVISDFTDEVEKDLTLQQHVYVAVNRVYARLEQLDTPCASEMLDLFHKRFTSTADFSLSKLAYYLTPSGVNEYRSLPESERRKLFKELKTKFKELTAKFPPEMTMYFPAIYTFFMNVYEIDPGDSPFYVFNELENEHIRIPGLNGEEPVSFSSFAIACKALVTLPASEAMVERCFSQVKSIATDFNKRMKIDFAIALSTLKLAIRYRRRYFFSSPETIPDE